MRASPTSTRCASPTARSSTRRTVNSPTRSLSSTQTPASSTPSPNLPVHATTSDPYWDLQWGLQNTGQLVPRIGGVIGISGDDIDAPDAWETTSGAGETVAVVDTGVELDQADLQGAIATNAGEIGIDSQGHDRETNGLDDDHDGYVDDWRGWDFVDRDNTPQDLNGHGTHVTGIIAARRDNGLGIAGVAPQAQVLPMRVLDASGSGSTANVANALDYAGDLGIKIVNASLGSTGFSKAEQDAISVAPQHDVRRRGRQRRQRQHRRQRRRVGLLAVCAPDVQRRVRRRDRLVRQPGTVLELRSCERRPVRARRQHRVGVDRRRHLRRQRVRLRQRYVDGDADGQRDGRADARRQPGARRA